MLIAHRVVILINIRIEYLWVKSGNGLNSKHVKMFNAFEDVICSPFHPFFVDVSESEAERERNKLK